MSDGISNSLKIEFWLVFLPAVVDNSLLKHAKPISNAGAIAPVVLSLEISSP